MWTGSSAPSRTRKLTPTDSLCWSCSATAGYWVAQLAGGLVATTVVGGLVHRAQVPAPTLYGHALLAAVVVVVEMLFTFALCYVVLNVATSRDHPDNSFYGLAIGFTGHGRCLRGQRDLRCRVQPGRSPRRHDARPVRLADVWTYLVAEIVAGAVAVYAFLALNTSDR
jgi:aquaporin Z